MRLQETRGVHHSRTYILGWLPQSVQGPTSSISANSRGSKEGLPSCRRVLRHAF
jgi:hypothetical protein